MLPPLALNPAQGAAVLDMCASPGSKTGFLAQLTGPEGFVLGNEPGRSRLATLRANLHTLNLLQAGTCSHPGESLPLPDARWDYIQLDPPCSGWGTAEKNPRVLTLWTRDKIKPLVALQRRLLEKAQRLLRPGGVVVYSTCTTHEEENEAQHRYAIDELGFTAEALPLFPGFTWEDPRPGGEGSLRVDGPRSSAQGFYITKLRKPGHAPVALDALPVSPFVLPQPLASTMLVAPCADSTLLPPGVVTAFGETARLIPRQAVLVLPDKFSWQAAPLGRVAGGRVHLSPRLRAIMPASPPSQALVMEKIDDIRSLLHGQSRATGLAGRETGLYWRDLPLGRLTLKNGRALWSAR